MNNTQISTLKNPWSFMCKLVNLKFEEKFFEVDELFPSPKLAFLITLFWNSKNTLLSLRFNLGKFHCNLNFETCCFKNCQSKLAKCISQHIVETNYRWKNFNWGYSHVIGVTLHQSENLFVEKVISYT